jgi:hypothetical protein
VTPDGAGVGSMQVFFNDARGWSPGDRQPETDATGRVEVTGLPRGEFSVLLSSFPPAPWARPDSTVQRVGPETREVIFRLREGTPIRGVVLTPAGAPGQAGVIALRGGALVAHAMAAKDGSFTLYVPAEDPGPFRLEVHGTSVDGGKGVRGEVDGVLPAAEGVTIRLREE